jgi:orotidine-5'-phosphate decarboxylase
MSTTELLEKRILSTQSFLCVGLDPEQNVLQKLGMEDRIFDLNVSIIDAVADKVCAFKPQFAHYAALGKEEELYKTCCYIKHNYPNIPVLLDGKRGDIGNTAENYAREAFLRYGVDAVTINPYMGTDTITPFLSYAGKAAIVLIKTSNSSSAEIQDLVLKDGEKLFLHIAEQLVLSHPTRNLWFVVGGTQIDSLKTLRERFPLVTFLVPGVGAQGGDLNAVVKFGMSEKKMGLVISISRGITSPNQPYTTIDEYIALVKESAQNFHELIKIARLSLAN